MRHCPTLHFELISTQSSSVPADPSQTKGTCEARLNELANKAVCRTNGFQPYLYSHFLLINKRSPANKLATKTALCFLHTLATVTFDKYHVVTLITCECSRMVEIIQSIHHNLHPDGTFSFSFWIRNCKERKLEERFW